MMVYRPPSNASEDRKILNPCISIFFSVDREVILITDFNFPSITWGNAHPFQGDFEPTTQAFVDAFVSFGLSQWLTESTFFSFY